MDMDEIHCKFPKMSNGSSNGRVDSAKLGQKMDMDLYQDEDDDENQLKIAGAGVDPAAAPTGLGRYYNWPSSRIVRVSRASGGKDRHSKVLTSKGLRDRRVRLSVNTAIQFYDLQDRLGLDQPSKAVEWLLKAAAPSIAELPPMNSAFFDAFPETPNSYEKQSSTTNQLVEYSTEVLNQQHHQQQQNVAAVTKSCSSNSETSKGSGSGGLSLSRSENRVKARDRAKERVQLEKEKETETSPHHPNVTSLHQATSFTELLNGGIGNRPNSPGANSGGNTQWGSAPMDYFSPGLLSRSDQMTPLFEPQQFSFLPDHMLGSNNGSGEYNLNFSMSSGNNNSNSSGYNRGTLQSNSSNSSLLPHQLQRFNNHTIEGSQPFFIQPADNHHQFLSGFDGRLHLSYGDSARRHGKGKN